MQNTCSNYRKIVNNYGLGHEKNNNFLKAVFIKKTIRKMLADKIAGNYNPSKLEKEVLDFFMDESSGFKWNHPEQAKKQAYDTTRQILRYTNSEARIPVYMDSRDIIISGTKVTVRPDEVFITTNSNGEKFYNIVRIKCTKPKISQAKANNGSPEAIELYELLKYGESIITKRNDEHVTANIYYLRKNTDRFDDADLLNEKFDSSFFGGKGSYSSATGSGNIIALTESFRNGMKINTTYDSKKHMMVQLPDYDNVFKDACKTVYEETEPEACTPRQCEACPIKAMCPKFFTEAPLAINEEKVVAKAKRIRMTHAQLEATHFDSGLCRINAGAGAGKTSVVKSHFMSLCEKGYDPEKILVITFTNSGAEEMRSRIVNGLKRNGIDTPAEKLWIMTFNAFGDILVKNHYIQLGYTIAPKLIDDIERSHIIANLLQSVPVIPGLDYRNFTMDSAHVKGALPTAGLVFTLAKKYQLSVADVQKCKDLLLTKYAISVREPAIEELLKLFDKYDDSLRANNLIEYDDQISLIFELLYQNPDFFNDYGFEHIIVDEFQDTDEQQINLLKALIDTPSFKSLMVVGDDSQAIYGFRDTSPEYIINFEKYIGAPLTDIYLLDNFRSTPEIIDFANKINNMNSSKIAKDLVAKRPSGDPVAVVGFTDTDEEYNYIVNQIKQNIEDGVKPEDIAFIGYAKSELRKMADLLSKEGITSVMMNPELLNENSRVQAGLALLSCLENPSDKKSELTYISAVNGKNLIELSYSEATNLISEEEAKLNECRRLAEPLRRKKILELLSQLNRNNDEVFESFMTTIEFKPTVAAMFEYAHDFNEFGDKQAFRRSHTYPGVVLTTAHSSKGLEWPVTYVSLSKFDSESLNSIKLMEERRRLLFVSATRARDRLVITGNWIAYTEVKDEKGKVRIPHINQFLKESFETIGETLDNKDILTMVSDAKERKAALRQMNRIKSNCDKSSLIRRFAGRKARNLRKKGRQLVARNKRATLR